MDAWLEGLEFHFVVEKDSRDVPMRSYIGGRSAKRYHEARFTCLEKKWPATVEVA